MTQTKTEIRHKCLLIINPISGTGKKRGVAARCMRKLSRAGIDVEVLYTEKAGDASKFAAHAAAKGYLGVIAAGGDGTVNEIATSLRGTGTALGIIPLGSGNGLARHLGLSMDPSEAIDVIARRHVVACDSCSVNERTFVCTFGLGFDAAVSDKFAKSQHRGLLNYIKSALLEYQHFQPTEYEITADGHTFRFKAFIVAACNASQYGNNIFIAPQASIKDGLVDITIIHADTPLTQARVGVELVTGLVKNNMIIQTLRVREAVIRRQEEGIAHVDGEPITLGADLHIRCNHGDLLMFTTGTKKPFRPLITPFTYLNREIRNRLRTLFNH
ncbi:MAG: YegS/Rv2252/BmrU family lipid kinase [Muribaculaceae bacterium]|nr:YegS/Rv2252/BmrU family lipid kinase [Muribaculaceae bacterium]